MLSLSNFDALVNGVGRGTVLGAMPSDTLRSSSAERLLQGSQRLCRQCNHRHSVSCCRSWRRLQPHVGDADAELRPSAPAMAEVHNYGFTLASDELHKPTCFAVTGAPRKARPPSVRLLASASAGSTRLDHIFVYGSVQGVSTKIPDCELGHPCNVVPCFHQLQMLMDLRGT
eukprot:1672842-Amphidinium_carterae.1